MARRTAFRRRVVLFAAAWLAAGGACGRGTSTPGPTVEITRVPEAAEGGPERLEAIEGRVAGASRGQQVVLYAKSGAWWVQPFVEEPFTPVLANGTWKARTHLGSDYAALLVAPGYRPQALVDELPGPGQGVLAVARAPGAPAQAPAPRKTLRFAGYEWAVRAVPSDRGVWTNRYDPENAWTDAAGALHLRIAPDAEGATAAEVTLTRSLGYGTYSFTVRDISHLPPSVVLGLFTWDEAAPEQRFREMDVEISRFGDPTNLNAQYVVQPYYVAANVRRFAAPEGELTHWLRWEAGRVAFKTVRGRRGRGEQPVADHVFTTGVPVPGNETVRMNLYVFGRPVGLPPKPTEVVIDAFEYLP